MADSPPHTISPHSSFLVLLLVGIVVAFAGFLRWSWLESVEVEIERRTKILGAEIAPRLSNRKPPRESIYRNTIAQSPRIAYLAIADFRTGYRKGVINQGILGRGAQNVRIYQQRYGNEATLAKLIKPGEGFPGEYLDVISVAFAPPAGVSDQTPVGLMKVGYVVPGYPFGRGYLLLWWGFMGLAGAFAAGWLGLARSRAVPKKQESEKATPPPSPPSQPKSEKPEKDELDQLEDEFKKDAPVEVDLEGKMWRLLFDGTNIDGWLAQGGWYVSEEDLVGQPWGGSLITTKVSGEGSYRFRLSAKKISGADGFVVLFLCDNQPLYWVLGGWNNTRSEVGGFPATAVEGPIEVNRWYALEIRLGPEKIEGFVNEKKTWELARAEVSQPSPEVGFSHGIGVAVWNTVAKFRDIQFLPE